METVPIEKLNVALITSGGTISTKTNASGIREKGKVDPADFLAGFNFCSISSPLCILSENLEFSDLEIIYKSILKVINNAKLNSKKDLDGIILTCGTDTLNFTSCAMSLLFYNANLPIVIVSSCAPFNHSESNAAANIKGAINFIALKKYSGVFVSYKNAGEAVKIHYGARLNSLRQFDGYVTSALNKECGYFDGNNFIANKSQENEKDNNCEMDFNLNSFNEKKEGINYIVPYVGLDYKRYGDYLSNNGNNIVVHDSFHSGTVKTDGENNINLLKQKVYLVGGLVANEKYESSLKLNSNILVYDNITATALHLKLLLSQNMSEKERTEYLKANTAHEYF